MPNRGATPRGDERSSALDAVQEVPVVADLGPFILAPVALVVADLLCHPARK